MSIAKTTTGAPDWSELDIALDCPRCGYNLYMLTRPKCPECGLDFDWDELIAAARMQVDARIFEYQWRRRPIGAYLGTLIRGFWAPALWRHAKLEIPPRAGSLLALTGLNLVLSALVIAAVYILPILVAHMLPAGATITGRSSMVGAIGYIVVSAAIIVACQAGLLLFWWVLLQIFQQSYRRYRVRQVHLLRIIAFTSVPLISSVTLVYVELSAIYLLSSLSQHDAMIVVFNLMYVLTIFASILNTVATFGLGTGRYLRIRWGSLIAIAVVVISLLAVFTALVAISAWF